MVKQAHLIKAWMGAHSAEQPAHNLSQTMKTEQGRRQCRLSLALSLSKEAKKDEKWDFTVSESMT